MNHPSWLTASNAFATLALSAAGTLGYLEAREHGRLRKDLDRRIDEARFKAYNAWHIDNENLFSLEVGVIQFLNNGFTITLDSVTYQPDGVRLVGTIGNPKSINVATLTLTFTAEENFEKAKERFLSSSDWSKVEDTLRVASAQVAVGTLNAGGRTPFKVLVPNVKQGGQTYDFHLSFSGERYWYRP